MSTASSSGLRRLWPAALIFVISLAVYIRTLCPTVFVEGTGENIVCASTLGVPHPPGFPLFCTLGKIFALLAPVGSAAYRINLFAAVMGGVAAAGLYLLLTAIGLGRLVSAAAALAFAFSATFWGQCVIAEVYSLSLTVVIIQIGLLLRWRRGLEAAAAEEPEPPAEPPRAAQATGGKARRRRDAERQERRRRAEQERARLRAQQARIAPHDRPLLWFALAFGLGLTVHYNQILLLPAYLYFIFAHDRSVFTRWRLAGTALLLVAAGFSLHLYAPIRSLADPAIDWGNPETVKTWWAYLTAQEYRGRMFHTGPVMVGKNLVRFLVDLPVEFWWLGFAAAVGGAVALFRRDRTLFWMAALIVIVVAFWSINYDIPWEIKVYYLQALLAMAIWIGFGLQAAAEWLARRGLRQLTVGVLAVPALACAANFAENDLSRQWFVLDNGLDVLDTVEPRAALLLPRTNPIFVLLYLTEVEGKASDLELWLRAEGGVQPLGAGQREGPPTPEPRFVGESLAEGVPVYAVDREAQTALPGFAQIPWGCLYRLVPADQAEEWAQQAPDDPWEDYRFQVEEQRFDYGGEQGLLACRYLMAQADYEWHRGERAAADRLYERALEIGESLPETTRNPVTDSARMLLRTVVGALNLDQGVPRIPAEIGQRYAEQDRPDLAIETYLAALDRRDDALVRNRLGAIYGRQNRLSEAQEQFERAIELNDEFGEAHANLASVYGRRGQIEKAIEELELAIKYEPNNLTALRNLGVAYQNLGRREDAIRVLRQALEVNPAQQDVRQLLDSLQK